MLKVLFKSSYTKINPTIRTTIAKKQTIKNNRILLSFSTVFKFIIIPVVRSFVMVNI